MTTFTTTLQNRRSIYDLGRNVTLSNEELTALIVKSIILCKILYNVLPVSH
ncbi:hypothetical protein EB10_00777 [Enterococcus hirae]|nr:hypothetical protein EB10_00777 [Enterococcus hirae]